MKREGRRKFICITGLWIGLLITSPALAGPPRPGSVQLLPDLAVRLRLVTRKISGSGNTACYSTMPEYTVTNQGQALARGFSVKIYRRAQGQSPGKAFRYWGESGRLALAPGRSWTHKASAVDENIWCANKTGQVGFRVEALYHGREKSKANNSATRLFPMHDFRLHQ